MKRIYLLVVVSVMLQTRLSLFADEGGAPMPGNGQTSATTAPAGACPTSFIAQMPQGSSQMICIWQIMDCTSGQSAGTVNAACEATGCQCNGGACNGTGPAIQLGLSISVTDELTGGGTRPRVLKGNRLVPQRTIPVPATLIPAAAASPIMPWGQGEWKVKYIKTLKLSNTSSDPNDIQYYGLYKVFKSCETNPDGLVDAETDQYVGFRVASEPAEPREIEPCAYNAVDRVKKMQTTTTGVRMEIGVKAPVTVQDDKGETVTLQKWFHVYGVYR